MISHKNKFIFIHIPKCAGSSIKDYYFDGVKLNWKVPNYEMLYGWCPERKIHLQHATPKQLIETNLISEAHWNSYFKFAIVRNPWDRAYSDYLWIQKDRRVSGSFKSYINKNGVFDALFNDRSTMNYRGDHLTTQSEFANDPNYPLDFIGRFESLETSIKHINQKLQFDTEFKNHSKRNSNRLTHYSKFYTNSNLKRVEAKYGEDIEQFNYSFEDQRTGLYQIKKML